MNSVHFFILFLLSPFLGSAQLEKRLPEYTIEIKSEEYPIFSQAVFNGVYKYNSPLAYHTKLSKEGEVLFCELTIENRETLNAIKYFLSEYTMDLIPSDQSANLTNDLRWKIGVTKGIITKLDQALMNPSRMEITLKGFIQTDGSTTYLTSPQEGNLILDVQKTLDLSTYLDQQVVLTGWLNEDQSIAPKAVYPVADHSLEVYIMSLCPYGLDAVSSLMKHLTQSGEEKTKLFVKYIFSEDNGVYTSLHGEKEMVENLVQMVIRDRYQMNYEPYMLARAQDLDVEWQQLAKQSGLSKREISLIGTAIKEQYESLITTEYQNNYHFDASPTFVWEGEKVLFLQHLEPFEDLQFGDSGACQ